VIVIVVYVRTAASGAINLVIVVIIYIIIMVVIVVVIVIAGLVEDFAECSDNSLLGTRRHLPGLDWLGLSVSDKWITLGS